jgi:translation initiation factor IF-1
MNDKQGLIELTGEVFEVLPSSTFRVRISESGHELVCYISGRLRKNNIRIILGDQVRLEVSQHDISRGRITYRL